MGNFSMDDPVRARFGASEHVSFYKDAVEASKRFREDYKSRLRVVKSKDMPYEMSPDGLIKHVMHENLNTAECCVDAYMQFIEADKKSGKHRHLSEEICVVLEGRGSTEVGKEQFDWEENDIFVLPNFLWRRHRNTGSKEAVLYAVSDLPLLEKIGQYRAQGRDTAGNLTNLVD